jgi:hypothetical protein
MIDLKILETRELQGSLRRTGSGVPAVVVWFPIQRSAKREKTRNRVLDVSG